MTRQLLGLGGANSISNFNNHLFAVAQNNNIKKISHRLRIQGTGTTGYDQGIVIATVFCP